MKLIDAHAHLQFSQFDDDREQVIARLRAAEVGVINVGTDLESSRAAVALAEGNDQMWATVGIHPTDLPPTENEAETFSNLVALASHPKVVGVGECGLDYARLPLVESERQEIKLRQATAFRRQVELALAAGKPLMIHCREARPTEQSFGRAYDDLLHILASDFVSRRAELRGNVHFFAGDWPTAKKFLDLGFYLSFTGVITFTSDYDEVVKKMPLDRLLAETDCPFVAPVPHRGRRNEPGYLPLVVNRLAELRHLPVESLAAATLSNAQRLFRLLR